MKMPVNQIRQIAANVRAVMHAPHAPEDDGRAIHDRIVAANAALFKEGYFSEPLTSYAVGFRDSNNIEETLNFFAPVVPVPRRFDHAVYSNIEEFLSDEADDDLRALKGDFKEVEYTSTKVNEKTDNRGLKITVDLDQVADKQNWRENYTAKILRRLHRNALRRAVALLSAAATNDAKTWDVTAGKDPDQDVITALVAACDASGIKPNRVGYGDTAWTKRLLAHRAQDSAGGMASAGLTPEQLAGFLGVDRVLHSKERYQSSASAKTQIVANLVLMFYAEDGQDTEDASNIKRFVSNTDGGGPVRVYEQQLTSKLYTISVEHYEKTKITSTLGIRKLTIS